MKTTPLVILTTWLLGAIALSFHSCTSSPQTPKRPFRLIHNNDGSDALYNRWFHFRPLCKADIEAYVDMVANSQVTTYMMCSGSDFVYYRSQYGRPFGDDLNGTLDCGNDTATLRAWKTFYQNFKNLEAEGTDVIEASLLRAQEKGMEAFITYRMNDLHFADTSYHCPIHYSDFWLAHPEYWLGDSTQGWHSAGALNFAIEAVRQRKLDIITEQLQKYEMIDGFDMDFMRFPVYFKSGEGPQNAHLITDLVRKVRAKVDSVSQVRGKKILLSVRVPFTVEGCLMKGLDVQTWVNEGLVEFISIGAHWKGETAMPVAKFRHDLGNDQIPIYATIDDGGYTPREFFSAGMYRGMASHILAQGGDGIQLFNYYFGQYNSELNGKIKLEEGGQVCRVIEPSLLQEIGKMETLKGRNKIFCESDGVTDTYGILQVGSLPLAISNSRRSSAHLYIGDDVQETVPEETILFIRTDRPARFQLEVNGITIPEQDQRPDYPKLYDRCRGMLDDDQVYAFVLPNGALRQGDNTISFVSQQPLIFVVRRLEAALKYGDVTTHGYF